MSKVPVNTIEITGKTFHRLTALHPTGSRACNGGVVWLFQCACGTKCELPGYKVKCGDRKDCGRNCALRSKPFADGAGKAPVETTEREVQP